METRDRSQRMGAPGPAKRAVIGTMESASAQSLRRHSRMVWSSQPGLCPLPQFLREAGRVAQARSDSIAKGLRLVQGHHGLDSAAVSHTNDTPASTKPGFGGLW